MDAPAGTLRAGRIEASAAETRDGLTTAGAAHDRLAEAWRTWGEDAPAHVDETFLVYDGESRRGVLARGRSGATPLLLAEHGGALSFAGDPGPLIDLLPAAPAPDVAGVAGWLAHGAPPAGRTLLTGVRPLAPGHHLVLGPGGWSERTHWQPAYAEPLRDRTAALETLLAALRDAVAAAWTPEAALLLSGGLDSTAVAALSPAPRPLALHGAFPGVPDVDESEVVDETVAALGLRGIRAAIEGARPLGPAAQHALRWRAPLGTPNDVLWSALLARAASEGARVVLDGEGGDSVLGPAPYYLADLVRSGRLRGATRAASALVGPQLAGRAVRRFGLIGALPAGPHHAWRRLRGARRHAPPWLRASAARALHEAAEPWAFKRLDGPRWWAQRADELIHGLDASGAHDLPRRRAAAAGLHARHPLQASPLIDLALRLHPTLLHDPARDRPLARDALAGVVPEHVRVRTDKPFFNPVQERWLVGERDRIAALLAQDALVGEYVDLAAVRAWAVGDPARHPHGRLRWPLDTWRVAAVEIWLQTQAGSGRIRDLAASGAAGAGVTYSELG